MGKVSDALSWYQNREPDRMALNFFFLTSVVIFIVYRKGVKRIKDTRSLPPGPRGLPVLGYLPFLRPDLHRCFADLAQTFGPLMTMWIGSRQCIIVSSSEAAREVCRDHDATFANHDTTAAARIISFGAQDMVFQPYSPKWRTLRKECVRELLNTKILDSFHALRQREVRSMVEELYRRTGEVVDVGQVAFVTVLNVVTAMLWGNSLPAEERERVGDEFRELVDGILHLIGVTNMSDIFPVLEWMDLQGVQRKMKEHKERLDRLLSMIIEQRKGTLEASGDQEKMKDFLQVMLEMVKEDPHQLLPKLTYLGAVIKEVLRLHPALPLLVPHCPSSTCTINGYTIPQGSQVFVNVWAIHRDPGMISGTSHSGQGDGYAQGFRWLSG